MPHASIGVFKSSHSSHVTRGRLHWLESLIAFLFFVSLFIGFGGFIHTPGSSHSKQRIQNVNTDSKKTVTITLPIPSKNNKKASSSNKL